MRTMWTVILLCLALGVAVPVATQLVHVLFPPIVVCMVLYLVIRLVNAYLNRW